MCDSPKAVHRLRFKGGQHPTERDQGAQTFQHASVVPVERGHEVVGAPVPLEILVPGQKGSDSLLQKGHGQQLGPGEGSVIARSG